MDVMRCGHQRRHTAAREPAPENVVMMRQCRKQACLAMFFVCLRCFSGQAYCSSDCREKNRRAQLREARARYQSSARGRELHRQRQRRYRRCRQTCRVTDHPAVRPAIASRRPAVHSFHRQGLLKQDGLRVRLAAQTPERVGRGVTTTCVMCGSVAKWIQQDSW